MKKDYKNRTLTFDSPEEEVKYNKHMAQFGPCLLYTSPSPRD